MRRKKRLRIEAEERRADWVHAREMAIWFGPKFKEWEQKFISAYQANNRALDRISAKRGLPPGPNRIQ